MGQSRTPTKSKNSHSLLSHSPETCLILVLYPRNRNFIACCQLTLVEMTCKQMVHGQPKRDINLSLNLHKACFPSSNLVESILSLTAYFSACVIIWRIPKRTVKPPITGRIEPNHGGVIRIPRRSCKTY